MLPKKIVHFLKKAICGLLIFLILFFVYLTLNPIKIDTLVSRSNPSKNFQESLSRVEILRKEDINEVGPEGNLILLDHGRKTKKVIVFFHGFTNSPRQFKVLGEKFYKLGYTVFIPRMPDHGLENRSSPDFKNLTAENLRTITDESIDIAQGLGEQVTVVGLSMGGVVAAWVAQSRPDVDRVVIIAPSFGTYRAPNFFLKQSINFLTTIPNHFIWWDSDLKENIKRPVTAYYGFSSRALGEIRRLGWSVETFAEQVNPKADSILIITNANDLVVKKAGLRAVLDKWKKYNGVHVQSFEFTEDLRLGHDFIDPQQPNQNIDLVYPKLIELIETMK